MNELEALAILKEVYYKLRDLDDNGISIYIDTIDNIADIYSEIFSKIKSNDPDKFRIEVEGKTYFISDNVYGCDYQDENDFDYMAGDLDYYWWFDEEFINKEITNG